MKLKLEKIGTSIVVIKMNVKVELKSTTWKRKIVGGEWPYCLCLFFFEIVFSESGFTDNVHCMQDTRKPDTTTEEDVD